jgi:predicted ATPase/DNA-binding SARP family transcriptional activator
MATLSLALLGPIQVFRGSLAITGFPTNKVLGLLVYLAYEARRPHRREALAGLLWPDQPEEAARANLRQTLARLRRILGDESAYRPHILIDTQSVQFNLASDQTLDVDEFSALVQASERHSHRHPENCAACARRWQRAVDLYAGDFLAGFFIRDSVGFEEWALVVREHLRRQVLTALGHLANYYERQGQITQAQAVLNRQLALDPWREEAHQQLMLLLARNGQRSAALAQYEVCRRLLDQELGVPPTAATTELYETIRAGGELAANPDTAEQTRRLRNLPAPPMSLVGRDNELAELAERLANPAQRLITLAGMGGIGKSRLAVAAAHSQAYAFDQGVVFVALASLSSAAFVTSAIATALGVVLDGQADPRDQLLAYLRSREQLLVLDNFEHLLGEDEPAAVELVADILAQAPGVSVLVTSRERLALSAEWVFELDGLPYPAGPAAEGQDVTTYAAVHLFLERAQQSQRHVALTAEELAAVVRICQLVQGLPLAIELAAAARRQQSCANIARELENNLAALATPLRDVPLRHRSMQAACAHSWHLLSPADQGVFRQLSVLRGFDAEGAATIAGAHGTVLNSLSNKSLVRPLGDGRFELHEVLRQYAYGQLVAVGAAETTERRHAEYFLALAEEAELGIQGTEESRWLAILDREHDNLRAALRWAMQQAESELALELAGGLWRYWYMRGYASEGRQWLEAALAVAAAETDQPRQARAKALDGAGVLAFQQGDQAQAGAAYAAAGGLYRALADQAGLATVLNHIGLLRMEYGENALAIQAYAESTELSRTLGNTRGLATALHNLGNLALLQNDTTRAEQVYDECLSLHRALGDRSGIALLSLGLGNLARRRGDQPRAKLLAERSLALAVEIGDQWTQATATHDLGLLAFDRGDHGQAMALLEAGRAAMAGLGALPGEAEALLTLAMVARHMGDFARASQHLRAGLAFCQSGNHAIHAADGLEQAARLAWAQGRAVPATQFAAAAATLRASAAPVVSLIDLESTGVFWAELQAALGEVAFAVHWTNGQTLSSAQAITAALAL